MPPEKPTSVSDLLQQGQGLLERLRRGSSQADEALQAVRAELPEEFARQVWGASARAGTLTVLVTSAVWATRVRYHVPGLREQVARRLGVTLERVTIRVRPTGPTPCP